MTTKKKIKYKNNSKMKRPSPIFYDMFTKPFRKWLKESKFRTQKMLAQQLDVSASTLTRYLKGQLVPPGRVMEKLVSLGFPREVVQDYYAKMNDVPIPQYLDKDDLLKILFEQQLLLKEWKELQQSYSERYSRAMDDVMRSNETINMLVTKCTKLEKEIKELKNQ